MCACVCHARGLSRCHHLVAVDTVRDSVLAHPWSLCDVLARASCNGDCAIRLPYLADIEWKIIYVGSAESEEHDQVLSMSLLSFFPTRRDNPSHTLSCASSLS